MADLLPDNLALSVALKNNQLTFRKTILYYLKKNAKPKVLLKLMQVTKYFYHKKFPFFIVKALRYYQNKWEYCPMGLKYREIREKHLSVIIPKLAVCDITCLVLKNEILSYDEFKFLISSNKIEKLELEVTDVRYSDGTLMPMERYFEHIENLKSFMLEMTDAMTSAVTFETAEKLTKVINPSTLRKFTLYCIPRIFHFEIFKEFMQSHPTVEYNLDFNFPLHESKAIQTFIKELVKNGLTKYCPPLIGYNGQIPDELYKLYRVYRHRFGYPEDRILSVLK